MLVGAAAVLARAERERRAGRQRRRERELGLRPGEPLGVGLRRMALAQAELAIELLDGGGPSGGRDAGAAGGAPDASAVHETRKALKRLRALLRLLAGELGEERFAHENAVLRDVARRLSGARDAEVMLATLDALIERHPRRLSQRGGVRRLRERLAIERRRMQGETLGDSLTLARALGELRAFHARAALWSLGERDGIELVAADLRRLYGQGRRRGRRAARRRGRDARAMHEWRKRVKDLRYVAETLGRKGIARRADELGETLGEDHDLAALEQWIRANAGRGPRSQRTGRSTRKLLLALIAKRRRKLQRRALRDGRRLYRAKPGEFVRELSRRAALSRR